MNEVYEEVIKGGQTYHSLEVTKNTKGYGWSVKVAGCDRENVEKTLVEVEQGLKNKYGDKTWQKRKKNISYR